MPNLGTDEKRKSAKLASKLAGVLSSDVTQFAKQNLDPTKINMIVTNALDILQGMGLASAVVGEALSKAGCETTAKGNLPQVGDKVWYGGQQYTVTKTNLKRSDGPGVELKDKKGTTLITVPGLDPRWGAKPGKKLKSLLDVMWSETQEASVNRTQQLQKYLRAYPGRKKAVIAELIKAKKPKLATAVSKMVTALHPLAGTAVWGKFCKMHIGAVSVRIEEYPPGGKTRGKRTGVFVAWWNGTQRGEDAILDALKPLGKVVKTKPYAACVQALEKIVATFADQDVDIDVESSQQKAVDAPNPMEHINAPDPFKNGEGVYITVDAQQRNITIKDTNDRNNDPTAFTQGKMAYKKAIDSFHDWKDLRYRDIMQFWGKKGVKYHSYLAMD